MANELSLGITFKYTPSTAGQYTVDPPDISMTVNMAGDHLVSRTMEVGTANEAADFGDITNVGYIQMTNVDQTNFVEWGPTDSTDYAGKLKPNESCLWRMPDASSTLYLKADTAACDVQFVAVED